MKNLGASQGRTFTIEEGVSGAECCDGRKYHHWQDTGEDPYNSSTSKYWGDPLQRCIDDCWFIAALVSVAYVKNSKLNTHPNYKFYDVPNETWGAAFEINGDLPVDQYGNLVYARSASQYIWPCLYEKAYAVWKANQNQPKYEDHLQGGRGAFGLRVLTGGQLGPVNTMPGFLNNKPKYPAVARTKDVVGGVLKKNHEYSVIKSITGGYQFRDPCGDFINVTKSDLETYFEEWRYVIV